MSVSKKKDSGEPESESLIHRAGESESTYRSMQLFHEADIALRRVSLRLQRVHVMGPFVTPYECPLVRNRTVEHEFSTTLAEIELLDAAIVQKEDFILKQVGADAELRKRSEDEMNSMSGKIYFRSPDFGFTRTPTWETLLEAQGVPMLRKRREAMVDAIYERHAETLEAIGRYLPTGIEKPITRAEARDRGIVPGEDYLVRQRVSTRSLQKRVTDLSRAIRSAEDRYQKHVHTLVPQKKWSLAEVTVLISERPELNPTELARKTGWSRQTFHKPKWVKIRERARQTLRVGKLAEDHEYRGRRVNRKPPKKEQ